MVFIIKFTDGAYNSDSGERNGFPCDRSEATRYPSLEVALEKAKDLIDVECIEDAVTGCVVHSFKEPT